MSQVTDSLKRVYKYLSKESWADIELDIVDVLDSLFKFSLHEIKDRDNIRDINKHNNFL